MGPNGAGKTTTVYMLATLIAPTAGKAFVGSFDVCKQKEKVRKSLGIVFQDPTLDTRLSAFDNLDIHGRLYSMPKNAREKRIAEVLDLVELTQWTEKLVKEFSGGMKRRLEIARGLMHTPKVLFLDEPTLGLDPQTRRYIWNYIKKLKKKGLTVLLTTHYMEEADELCDRIAIMDKGLIKVINSPKKLKNFLGGQVLEITTSNPEKLSALMKKARISSNGKIIENKLSIKVSNGSKAIPKVMQTAQKNKVKVESVEMRVPSLEDVFLHYTGRKMREEKAKTEYPAKFYAR